VLLSPRNVLYLLCRKLSLSRKLPCGKCNGSGSKTGRRDQCDTCHGTGVQVMIRPIGPGMVQQIQQACKDCSGNGFCAKPSRFSGAGFTRVVGGLFGPEGVLCEGLGGSMMQRQC
jgi:hypothetical protein